MSPRPAGSQQQAHLQPQGQQPSSSSSSSSSSGAAGPLLGNFPGSAARSSSSRGGIWRNVYDACESKVGGSSNVRGGSACWLFYSLVATITLSVWGYWLCTDSMSIEIRDEIKYNAGKTCYATALLYFLTALGSAAFLAENCRRSSTSSLCSSRFSSEYIARQKSRRYRFYGNNADFSSLAEDTNASINNSNANANANNEKSNNASRRLRLGQGGGVELAEPLLAAC